MKTEEGTKAVTDKFKGQMYNESRCLYLKLNDLRFAVYSSSSQANSFIYFHKINYFQKKLSR